MLRVFCVKVSRDGGLCCLAVEPRHHSLRIIRSLDGVRPASNVLFRLAHPGWRHTGTINWDLLRCWAERAESGPGKALNTVMNIRLRFQRYKSSESELQQDSKAGFSLVSYCGYRALIGQKHVWCFHERETRHWQRSETCEPLRWRSKLRMSDYNSQVNQKLSKFTRMLSL